MKQTILAVALLSLAACGGPASLASKSPDELKTEGLYDVCMAYYFTGTSGDRRQRIVNELARRNQAIDYALVNERSIRVGMSRCELLMSWGGCTRINRSSHGPDQWVYANKGLYSYSAQFVYVKNNTVVAWN